MTPFPPPGMDLPPKSGVAAPAGCQPRPAGQGEAGGMTTSMVKRAGSLPVLL
jgi:hypothetical protein